MKIAFQAAVPYALWNDAQDTLHRVVKPMIEQIRKQSQDKGLTEDIRISIMIDTPEKPQAKLRQAIKDALADGTVIDAVQ